MTTGYLGSDGIYRVYSGSNTLSPGGAYTIEPRLAATYSDSVSESMGLFDTVSAEEGDAASDSESMGLSDSISVSAIFVAAVTEHMGLLDSVIGDLGDEASESESMGLMDSTDAVLVRSSIPGMIIFVAG